MAESADHKGANETSSLDHRVAIVTGAAQGIGKAIAFRLARDGYDVSINDIPSKETLLKELAAEIKQSYGRKSYVALGDVSVEADVEKIIKSTVDALGGVDVMVANAGVCLGKPFIHTTVEEWDRIFSINARGTFLCYKHAATQMIAQGRGGRIIGACSGSGTQGVPYLGAYGATKWAIRGMTATAALELGAHGITVNAYAPGAIVTEMTTNLATSFGLDPATLFAEEKKKAAVGYTGKPEDVAGIVSYLASKDAHFLTGQTILIDGGRV